LPSRKGSGSKVLDGRLENFPKDRPPGYAADLALMHWLITKGPGVPWAGAAFMAHAVGTYPLLRRKADRSRRVHRA
jgi:hypothetical protein